MGRRGTGPQHTRSSAEPEPSLGSPPWSSSSGPARPVGYTAPAGGLAVPPSLAAWVRASPPSPLHRPGPARPRLWPACPAPAPRPLAPAPTAGTARGQQPRQRLPRGALTCSGAGCPAGSSAGPAARPRPRSRPPPRRRCGSFPARRGPRGPCGSSSWPECGCPAPRPPLPSLSLTAAVYRPSAHAAVNRDAAATARPPSPSPPPPLAIAASSCPAFEEEVNFSL